MASSRPLHLSQGGESRSVRRRVALPSLLRFEIIDCPDNRQARNYECADPLKSEFECIPELALVAAIKKCDDAATSAGCPE
jgi:hypothetical protein